MLWVPPESITSASPRRMISVASPMAWLLAAQAVRQLTLGPWASNRPARWPAGMFGSCSDLGCGFESLQARLDKRVDVELALVRWRGHHHVVKAYEVLLALAAAR